MAKSNSTMDRMAELMFEAMQTGLRAGAPGVKPRVGKPASQADIAASLRAKGDPAQQAWTAARKKRAGGASPGFAISDIKDPKKRGAVAQQSAKASAVDPRTGISLHKKP